MSYTKVVSVEKAAHSSTVPLEREAKVVSAIEFLLGGERKNYLQALKKISPDEQYSTKLVETVLHKLLDINKANIRALEKALRTL